VKREKTETIHVSMTRTPSTADWGGKEFLRDAMRQGYSTVLFHYFIRRCGTVVPARDPDSHCLGLKTSQRNSTTIRVAIVGGLEAGTEAHNFQPCQLRSLQDLLASLQGEHPGARLDIPNLLQEALKGLNP
jgi:hypothetical protein